jgi:hypothetical protein
MQWSTSFHSKRYLPSSVLSHRRNSHASRSMSAPVASERGAMNSSTRLKCSLYFHTITRLQQSVTYRHGAESKTIFARVTSILYSSLTNLAYCCKTHYHRTRAISGLYTVLRAALELPHHFARPPYCCVINNCGKLKAYWVGVGSVLSFAKICRLVRKQEQTHNMASHKPTSFPQGRKRVCFHWI